MWLVRLSQGAAASYNFNGLSWLNCHNVSGSFVFLRAKNGLTVMPVVVTSYIFHLTFCEKISNDVRDLNGSAI